MRVGTKSVLFGAHCFAIHPWFVASAWWSLYGFPNDLRLWVAFAIHDLGYFGKPNMDGPEGESHVEWAAGVMARWFGPEWGDFCRYHSRYYAKRDGRQFSRLCVADKLALSLEPWWLYLPRVIASGEIREYMAMAGGKDGGKYAGEPNSPEVTRLVTSDSQREWFNGLSLYMRQWVAAHKDGGVDNWTPNAKP